MYFRQHCFYGNGFGLLLGDVEEFKALVTVDLQLIIVLCKVLCNSLDTPAWGVSTGGNTAIIRNIIYNFLHIFFLNTVGCDLNRTWTLTLNMLQLLYLCMDLDCSPLLMINSVVCSSLFYMKFEQAVKTFCIHTCVCKMFHGVKQMFHLSGGKSACRLSTELSVKWFLSFHI